MSVVNEAQLLEVFHRIAPALERDPLFNGGEVTQMETYLNKLPSSARDLFSQTLQGCDPAYRYAGMILMAELVRAHAVFEKFEVSGDLEVTRDEMSFFSGALHVRGNLVLGDRSIVVVAEDLRVDGNFLGAQGGYSLLAVAGAMTTSNLMTSGELLVGKSLAVKDSAYFSNNLFTARSMRISARVLVQNDRIDHFGRVYVGEHITDPLAERNPEQLQKVCTLLGLQAATDVQDLEAAYRALLLESAG